jgi:hypothetical protein
LRQNGGTFFQGFLSNTSLMFFAFFFVMRSCGFKESNSISTFKFEKRQHSISKKKRSKKHISWKEKRKDLQNLALPAKKTSCAIPWVKQF